MQQSCSDPSNGSGAKVVFPTLDTNARNEERQVNLRRRFGFLSLGRLISERPDELVDIDVEEVPA